MLVCFRVNGGATTIASRDMRSNIAIIAQVCRQNTRQIRFVAGNIRVKMVAAIAYFSSPLSLEHFHGILRHLWWVNVRLIQTDIRKRKRVLTVIFMTIYIRGIQPDAQVTKGDANNTPSVHAGTIDVAQTTWLAL